MPGLRELIEDLSARTADSDLLALLAAGRERRLYNAALAATLRELIEVLKREMDLPQEPILPPSDEIRVAFETVKPAKPSNIPHNVPPMFTGEVSSSIS
jgi:hypothetical protein